MLAAPSCMYMFVCLEFSDPGAPSGFLGHPLVFPLAPTPAFASCFENLRNEVLDRILSYILDADLLFKDLIFCMHPFS